MSFRRKKDETDFSGVRRTPLDKPREECNFNEIYPHLDASTPLPVFLTRSKQAEPSSPVNDSNNVRPRRAVLSVGKKPSFRKITPFSKEESFVDKKLSSAGFQETDEFTMPLAYIRTGEPPRMEEEAEVAVPPARPSGKKLLARPIYAEYDMDEQDEIFLNMLNKRRLDQEEASTVSKEVFEITMTLLEIEWYLLERRMPPKKKAAVSDEPTEVDDQRCTICDEAECDNSNAIVFCDSCDIAVHQECYGIPFIPEGQWLCAQCKISRHRKAACVFCPNKIGALKPTESEHWAHVVCALWVPEASFRNLIYMQPICGVTRIPKGRWKLTCYICKYRMGACIQCSNKNCFQAYHATCARKARLYMKFTTGPLGALHDPSTMVSYCNRHSPREHLESAGNIENTVKLAQDYYDSKRVNENYNAEWSDPLSSTTVVKATKFVRKPSRGFHPWRTQQGTPVIPQLIVNHVSERLQRFHVLKSKEFIYEISRYWALKLQNRHGAALSKRLQMALDASQQGTDDNEVSQTVEQIEECYKTLNALKKLLVDEQKTEAERVVALEKRETQIDEEFFPVQQSLSNIWKKLNNSDVTAKHLASLPLQDLKSANENVINFDGIGENIRTYLYANLDEFEVDWKQFIDAVLKVTTLADVKKTANRMLRLVATWISEARSTSSLTAVVPATNGTIDSSTETLKPGGRNNELPNGVAKQADHLKSNTESAASKARAPNGTLKARQSVKRKAEQQLSNGKPEGEGFRRKTRKSLAEAVNVVATQNADRRKKLRSR